MPESPIPKALSTFLKHNEEDKERKADEVESDAQEWELALDGIKTIEKKEIL